MAKNKVKMPRKIYNKCAIAIHSATGTAGAAAAIPIPVADRVPITAAQVAMVVALGKVFDITISDAVAKAVIGCGIAQQTGQAIVDGILKAIPGANVFVAPVVCTITAAGFTEALGWVIADDFYRMSIGDDPESIIDYAEKIKVLFKDNIKKDSKEEKKRNIRKSDKKSASNLNIKKSNKKKMSTKKK